MAEVLEDYDFPRAGRQPNYPYDQWFNGQIWKLQYMIDFECQANSLRQCFYGAAKRRGIRVKVSVMINNDVVVQRTD